MFSNWGLLLKCNGYSLFGLFIRLFSYFSTNIQKNVSPFLLIKAGPPVVRGQFKIMVKDMNLHTLLLEVP